MHIKIKLNNIFMNIGCIPRKLKLGTAPPSPHIGGAAGNRRVGLGGAEMCGVSRKRVGLSRVGLDFPKVYSKIMKCREIQPFPTLNL